MPTTAAVRATDRASAQAPPAGRPALWALAAGSAAAAGVHLAVGQQHDFAGRHGLFFVAAGIVQAVAAVLAISRPRRRFLLMVAASNVLLVVTWLVVRTPGLPAGDALDPLAVTAVAAELVALGAAIHLLGRPTTGPHRVPAMATFALVALTAVGIASFGDDGHGDHHDPGAPVTVVAAVTEADSGVVGRSEAVVDAAVEVVVDAEPGPVPAAPVPGDDHHGEDAEPHGH